jgi:Bromodomain
MTTPDNASGDQSATTGSGAAAGSTSLVRPGQEEPLERIKAIVVLFMEKDDSLPFHEPVDWRALELYDYPVVIKKMMDLGTILKKLERNSYRNAAECARDVRRVWTNCMT